MIYPCYIIFIFYWYDLKPYSKPIVEWKYRLYTFLVAYALPLGKFVLALDDL